MIDVIVDEHLLSGLRLLVVIAMALIVLMSSMSLMLLVALMLLIVLMSFEAVGARKRRLTFAKACRNPPPSLCRNSLQINIGSYVFK